MANMSKQKLVFTPVDISSFFDTKEILEYHAPQHVTILTQEEKTLVDNLSIKLETVSIEALKKLQHRMERLERLEQAISYFPSLLQRHSLTMGERTPEGLIDSLITYSKDGDTILHLPSKAQLGKGFLVAKIHTFDAFYKLAKEYHLENTLTSNLKDATVSVMFLLLVEDVYLNLIRDKKLDIDLRRQLAMSLLLLWEHRSDQNIKDIAPVLQQVWQARRTLAPAFGTMAGTSEMLLMAMQMDTAWTDFMKQRLKDDSVSQAMEEFLFGLSYEQILKLREILKAKNITAINRDEASFYLKQRVKTDVSLDYRDFYLLYTVRRDNARARARLKLPGPDKTLEDYFICFVMQKNKKKQETDAIQKSL